MRSKYERAIQNRNQTIGQRQGMTSINITTLDAEKRKETPLHPFSYPKQHYLEKGVESQTWGKLVLAQVCSRDPNLILSRKISCSVAHKE